MIQVKGRDISADEDPPGVSYDRQPRLRGVESGRGLSINGGNSLNKNTTIAACRPARRGGGTTHITPNIDAIGE